jgi:tRNA (cytidine32/uridine32-2'-O)-methyltransferase
MTQKALSHPRADDVHVVLVETTDPLNIGMVARAMSNLGFKHLHLVRPRKLDRQRSNITACQGEYLLDSMQVHDSVAEVVAQVKDVVGFEPKAGRAAYLHYELSEWVSHLKLPDSFPCALLFGSEDEGLSNRDIEHCRALVSLPTYGANYSFNLAQSVLLGLFSVTQAEPAQAGAAIEELPLWAEYSQLDHLMRETLVRSGFYSRKTNAEIPAILKSLVRRARPTKREMQILLGVFSQSAKALRGDVPVRRMIDDPPTPKFAFPADSLTFDEEE